jgi:aldehyde:ferredoxin oxidoreductase
VIQLLELIARRKGIGKILAEGEKRAPKILGRGEELMPHVKGMTFADGEPRGAYLQALGYSTSTRGGDHLRKGNVTDGFSTEFDLAEQLFGTTKAIDPLSPEGKGRAVHWGENVGAVDDSIGLCKFLTKFSQLPALTLEDIAPLVSSATGFNFSASTLFNIGERIYTIEKAFNIREGLERKDDYLPKRFLEPHPDGLPGVPLDKMLDDYYESRGWDKKTGLIPRKKFEELGLREIADELEALGKLPKG